VLARKVKDVDYEVQRDDNGAIIVPSNCDPLEITEKFVSQPMSLGSAKHSIFDKMQGCHEKRFVPFNDISVVNSKYPKPLAPDFDKTIARGPLFYTTEEMPDYE
jgi:hypothetical protein